MRVRSFVALLVVVLAVLFVLYGSNDWNRGGSESSEKVVIVVGGGAAGMSAAVEALRSGSSVYLFDKGMGMRSC